jgi:hypothetical protein
MAARKRTSKKPSAASSKSASPPDAGPVFFLDRDFGKRDVAEALRGLGAVVKLHDELFAATTKDTDWLPQVGANRWVVLTRDKHILTRPLEVVALVRANTHVFILKSRQELNGAQMAAALVKAYPHMCRLIKSHSPPFLARVTKTGAVQEIEGYKQLQMRLERIKPEP